MIPALSTIPSPGSTPFLGEAAAIGAAFLWAVSVGIFRSAIERHGARAINLCKCLLAAILQGLTVLVLGQIGALTGASTWALVSLGASGIIGLVVGDTALFSAVARIGVSRTLLLQTLAPLFAAVLAAFWSQELPTPRQSLGGLIVLAGVAVVVAPSRRGDPTAGRSPDRAAVWGLLLATLAAFGQGAGVVLAKSGMEEVTVIPASFFRLAVAAVGLALVAAAGGRLGRLAKVTRDGPALARVIPATFLGTYLALFLMMAGVALAPASVAAVLLSTSPVFALFIESAIARRPPPLRGLVGTTIALAGVALLTL